MKCKDNHCFKIHDAVFNTASFGIHIREHRAQLEARMTQFFNTVHSGLRAYSEKRKAEGVIQ